MNHVREQSPSLRDLHGNHLSLDRSDGRTYSFIYPGDACRPSSGRDDHLVSSDRAPACPYSDYPVALNHDFSYRGFLPKVANGKKCLLKSERQFPVVYLVDEWIEEGRLYAVRHVRLERPQFLPADPLRSNPRFSQQCVLPS